MSIFSTAGTTIRRTAHWFPGCTLGRRIRCIKNIIPPSRFDWIALCKKESRITKRLVHSGRTVVANFGGLNRCELQCRNVRLSAHQKHSLAGPKLSAVIQRIKGENPPSFHAPLDCMTRILLKLFKLHIFNLLCRSQFFVIPLGTGPKEVSYTPIVTGYCSV